MVVHRRALVATGSPGGRKGTSFTYYVVAYDAAGNVSARSNTVSVSS